jgi:uncharacterized protein
MRILVKVKVNARHETVEKVRDGYYEVAVKAKAVGGQANEAVVKVVAKYFKVSLSQVRIVIGKTNQEKMVEVNGV